MGMWIGRNRKARVTYGFDEIALVPGEVTINPNEVDTSFEIPRPGGREPLKLKIPIIASAMDGVTNVRFCIEMAQARRPRRGQSRGRADPLRRSRGRAGPDRQGRQEHRHRADPEALHPADQGRADRQAGAGIAQGRRHRRRLLHPAKGGAVRRHRAGSGRRSLRRAVDRLDRPPHFQRVQVARPRRASPRRAKFRSSSATRSPTASCSS